MPSLIVVWSLIVHILSTRHVDGLTNPGQILFENKDVDIHSTGSIAEGSVSVVINITGGSGFPGFEQALVCVCVPV